MDIEAWINGEKVASAKGNGVSGFEKWVDRPAGNGKMNLIVTVSGKDAAGAERLTSAFAKESHDVEQILAAALGYSKYGEGGPGNEEDYCIGDHVPASLAMEAADKIGELRERKDAAYQERNQCVALIARLAHMVGYRVVRTMHEPTAAPGQAPWEPEWWPCVYIELPTGQISWHYNARNNHLFDWISVDASAKWDGHSTPEKYARIERAVKGSEVTA